MKNYISTSIERGLKKMKSFNKCLLILASIIFFAGYSFAQTPIYVDSSRPDDSGDGLSPATAKKTIQAGVNAVASGGTVYVAAGTYDEDVTITTPLSLIGDGAGSTTVRGIIGGGTATIKVSASNVTVSGFTITRLGNNPTDWDAGLNLAGIAIIGNSLTNMLIHDNIIIGNRTGIDINNSSGHTIRNNIITDNRTGLIFRNQTDNITVVENEITDNWTVGILFLDASGGTNSPVQTALNCTFRNNNISGNWYGQIVDRQTGGSLPTPGTTNLKNFWGNWFGTTSPTVSTNDSAEPGYSALIPVAYGGASVPPGGQPDILGTASANFDYSPFLNSDLDTDVETVVSRGTFGFQGDFSNLWVDDGGAQTSGITGRIQEGISELVSNGTLKVSNGIYNENVNINKSLTLQSDSGAVNTIISAAGGTAVTINADEVVIDGFTITNPSGKVGILSQDHSDITIINNIINDVGSTTLASGTNYAIGIVSSSAAVDNVLIQGNTISHVIGGDFKSADGIAIGWSNGNFSITNLNIVGNDISDIKSSTLDFASGGRGAYGIILNHTTGSPGQTVAPQILNNTIDDLEGLWTHGIGLEGNTPNALVQGNSISNLIDHKSPGDPDAVAVMVEDNASANTVTINGNSFFNVLLGVRNQTVLPINAKGNYWGDLDPSDNIYAPGGGAIDYSPWWSADYIASPSHPWTWYTNDVIQDAIDYASASDIIKVEHGTYNEGIVIDKNLTLMPAPVSSPSIVPPSGDVVTINGAATNVTINGFAFFPGISDYALNNVTATTVNAENNYWDTIVESEIIAKINGSGVDYDPWIGKPSSQAITNANVGQSISFPNTDVGITFTVLPPNTNASITVSQISGLPNGVPAPPAGQAAPVYIDISAIGLTNYQFSATIVIDVSNIPGFDESTVVMRYDSTVGEWVIVNGTYDSMDQTFTFTTDHFTTFAFLLNVSSTPLWDIEIGNVTSYNGAQIYVPINLDLNGLAGFNAFQGKFHFDVNKLEFVTVNIGSGTVINNEAWKVYFQNLTAGIIDFLGVGIDPLPDATDDIFFKLVFKIIDPSAGSTAITGDPGEFLAEDVDSLFDITNGTVTYTIPPAPSGARGDATLDFVVNLQDVNALIDHLNSISLLTGQAAINADADSSGTLTINDVNYILYYLVNGTWPTSPSPSLSASTKVAFGQIDVRENGLIDIPIDFENAENAQSLELTLSYDANILNYQSFVQALDDNSNLVSAREIAPGKAKFIFASGKSVNGDFTTGKILFRPFGALSPNSVLTSVIKINNGDEQQGPSVNLDGITGVDTEEETIPTEYSLTQNYPNPFNPSTTIQYSLPQQTHVVLKIYNMLGQEVATLVNTTQSTGRYSVRWDGTNDFGSKVSSGTYIYRVTAGDFVQVKKMVLLK